MKLRDYQADCIRANEAAWQDHDRLLNVLPTGMGKTEIFVNHLSDWQQGRTLIVAPLISLVAQAAKKICQLTGIYPAIEQGTNRSNEHESMRSPFIVASKASLCSKDRYKRFSDIGLVVVDEAHLSITEPNKQMLDWFADSGAKILGVTATPKRHDKKGLHNVFDHCSYSMGIAEAMPLGWLVGSQSHCVQIRSLDLKDVAVNSGDFNQAELSSVFEEDRVTLEIADVTARESRNLKTVVFCQSVKVAEIVADLLRDRYGFKADWICADKRLCPDDKRKTVLRSFTEDPEGLEIVCNVGILTTGWDYPGLEHIVLAKSTKSKSLYQQIYGRGTRPLEGVVDFEGSTPESRLAAIAASDKPHFKMTDLCDVSLQHKLITAVDVLGGDDMDVILAAKKLQMNSGPTDLAEILEQAKKQVKQVQDERERAKRAALLARAEYDKVRVDHFNSNQVGVSRDLNKSGARMVYGKKYMGQLLSEIPTGYLEWCVGPKNQYPPRKPWLLGAIRKELLSRMPAPRSKYQDIRRQLELIRSD